MQFIKNVIITGDPMISFGSTSSLADSLARCKALSDRLKRERAAEAKTEKESEVTKENIYNLKDGPGLIVTDKLNGIAQVQFKGFTEDSHRPKYEILLNGKKLIFPTSSESPLYGFHGFSLVGSQKITFERIDSFIKITEVDEKCTSEFYIDDSKTVNEQAYDVYVYLPKSLTLDEAVKKISNLASQSPTFNPEYAVFNRHGVAVTGWDKEAYALYWANPHEAYVKKIACSQICYPGQNRDGGGAFAKADNGSINFRRNLELLDIRTTEISFYLNAEKATEIDLKTLGLQQVKATEKMSVKDIMAGPRVAELFEALGPITKIDGVVEFRPETVRSEAECKQRMAVAESAASAKPFSALPSEEEASLEKAIHLAVENGLAGSFDLASKSKPEIPDAVIS
jgi:hypothetical protein